MTSTRALAALLLLLPVSVLADDAPVVVQKDKRFSVASLTVPQGSKVSFANQDDIRHNIALRGPDGADRTGIVQAPGDVTSIGFDQAGLFMVHCLIHPQMRMTVQAQ